MFALFLFYAETAVCRTNKSDEEQEKVALFTDRSIYIVGEKLHFFAVMYPVSHLSDKVESEVLYCELIAPDGEKIAGSKNVIINSAAEGCLPIPDDLPSGTYYIRAYSKLMRNSGPESYEYKPLKIINPGWDEVLPGTANLTNENGNVEGNEAEFSTGMIGVSVDNNTARTSENIVATIESTDASSKAYKGLCISVVPEIVLPHLGNVIPNKKLRPIEYRFYAENQGLSLTGKLTEGTDRKLVSGKRINLSIIGEGRDFMAVRTDNNGRFFFSLPAYYGSRDLFLCAEKTTASDLKIWIDNDFCSLPVSLPSPVFSLSDQERASILSMARNKQINSHFQPDSTDVLPNIKLEEKAFYGEPTTILYLDQYVQLPTLEEYFNELPGLVKVRKRNGEPYFKIIGSSNLSFYDPLVMIDWVAVDELSKILAVAPQSISRIEIVNETYIKGGQTYGGVISLISKKGDFAGIDLPSAGIFINYSFFSENLCRQSYPMPSVNQPDARNTVLWETGITLPKGDKKEFAFKAPDTPGNYIVVVEGLTTEGERVISSAHFKVENQNSN